MKQEIQYTIRRSSRAKHISLSLRKDSSLILTLPIHVDSRQGLNFIGRHQNWIEKKLAWLKTYTPLGASGTRTEFLKHKDSALALVTKKVEHYSALYGLSYKKITIRNQRSRWGSCSKTGNLSFNYKIVFLPESLANYLVVHEVCHLKAMNHSKDFWDLVAQAVPNYKELRTALRKTR